MAGKLGLAGIILGLSIAAGTLLALTSKDYLGRRQVDDEKKIEQTVLMTDQYGISSEEKIILGMDTKSSSKLIFSNYSEDYNKWPNDKNPLKVNERTTVNLFHPENVPILQIKEYVYLLKKNVGGWDLETRPYSKNIIAKLFLEPPNVAIKKAKALLPEEINEWFVEEVIEEEDHPYGKTYVKSKIPLWTPKRVGIGSTPTAFTCEISFDTSGVKKETQIPMILEQNLALGDPTKTTGTFPNRYGETSMVVPLKILAEGPNIAPTPITQNYVPIQKTDRKSKDLEDGSVPLEMIQKYQQSTRTDSGSPRVINDYFKCASPSVMAIKGKEYLLNNGFLCPQYLISQEEQEQIVRSTGQRRNFGRWNSKSVSCIAGSSPRFIQQATEIEEKIKLCNADYECNKRTIARFTDNIDDVSFREDYSSTDIGMFKNMFGQDAKLYIANQPKDECGIILKNGKIVPFID